MRKNPSILLSTLLSFPLLPGPRLIVSSGQSGKSYSTHGEFSSRVPPLSPDSQQDGTNSFPLHTLSLSFSPSVFHPANPYRLSLEYPADSTKKIDSAVPSDVVRSFGTKRTSSQTPAAIAGQKINSIWRSCVGR